MEPTADEFLTLAEERLDLAAIAISDGAKVSGATCAALSAVIRALTTLNARYCLTPHGQPLASWQPDFADLLADAVRRIRRHANAEAVPSPADELIGDAARLTIVAQDLLATHLTVPDPPRPFARTPAGADLLDIPAREQLLRRAVQLTGHLARIVSTAAVFDDLTRERPHLADAYRPRDRDLAEAARELAEAAGQRLELSDASLTISSAPVMSAPISYPQPHEKPAEAANLLRDALERLATAAYQAAHPLKTGERPPAHTAGDVRETAASLALAHVLAADLLVRLVPHLPTAAGWNFAEVADRLRATGAAWAWLRRPWEHTTSVPDSGPRSPLAVQAAGIPLRLGRLLYDDPTWTPQRGPARPRSLGDLLVAGTLDAVCIAISTLPRAAATIAANHALLITGRRLDLYSTDRTHRPEGDARRFYPLQPAQRAELVNGYQAVTHASKDAAASVTPLSRGCQSLRAAALMRASHLAARSGHAQVRQAGPMTLQPATSRSVAPSNG